MSVIEVAIGPGDAVGALTVEVVRSEGGEAAESVWLDAEELLARCEQLEPVLLASPIGARRINPTHEGPVREIGEQLFTTLLGTGRVGAVYRASSALAVNRGNRCGWSCGSASPPWRACPGSDVRLGLGDVRLAAGTPGPARAGGRGDAAAAGVSVVT